MSNDIISFKSYSKLNKRDDSEYLTGVAYQTSGFQMWACACGARGLGDMVALTKHMRGHDVEDEYNAYADAVTWSE